MAKYRYYAGPPSDHFDGTRFFNPDAPATDRTLRQVLRWKLAGGAARSPQTVPVTPTRPMRASTACGLPPSATRRC